MPIADDEKPTSDIRGITIDVAGIEGVSGRRAYLIGDVLERGGSCKTYLAKWIGDDPAPGPSGCKGFVFKAYKSDIFDEEIEEEIKMLGVFQDVEEIVHVADTVSSALYRGYFTPRIEPGELLGYLDTEGWEHLSDPDDIKPLVRSFCRGLRAMHGRGYAHGDIKLENLLLEKKGDGTFGLVICDLGHARVIPGEGEPGTPRWRVAPPTLNYRAPEVIRDWQRRVLDEPCGWGLPADIWSFGWVLFYLLTHKMPFHWCDDESPWDIRIHEAAVLDRGTMHREPNKGLLEGLGAAARDLVLRCLEYDPSKRITVEGILEHRWLQEVPDRSYEIE